MSRRSKIIYAILFIIIISFISAVLYTKYSPDTSKKLLENSSSGVKTEQKTSDKKLDKDELDEINKLNGLKKVNDDTKAIIKIEGTNIYYPVMQSKDNEFYLRKNIKKDYDINGSIFFDYECIPGKSDNTIVYGHNMSNENMFSDLVKYKDRAFFDKHRTVELYYNGEVQKFKIIGVYVMDLTKESTYDYNLYVNKDNSTDSLKYLDLLSKNAIYYDKNIKVSKNSRLITLSTCSYETDDARTVVVGVEEQK